MKAKKITASILFFTLFSITVAIPCTASSAKNINNMMPPSNNNTSFSHGSSTTVTKDMLNTTIPEDYEVFEDLSYPTDKSNPLWMWIM